MLRINFDPLRVRHNPPLLSLLALLILVHFSRYFAHSHKDRDERDKEGVELDIPKPHFPPRFIVCCEVPISENAASKAVARWFTLSDYLKLLSIHARAWDSSLIQTALGVWLRYVKMRSTEGMGCYGQSQGKQGDDSLYFEYRQKGQSTRIALVHVAGKRAGISIAAYKSRITLNIVTVSKNNFCPHKGIIFSSFPFDATQRLRTFLAVIC